MNVVAEMERTFLPRVNAAMEALTHEFPNYKFVVTSSSIGGLTEYQGHNIFLECLFPDAADHEADCVALGVGVMHITTYPKMCDASVEWCSGASPDVRASLIDEPVPFTEESLAYVANLFPELLLTFRKALAAWPARES